MDQLGTITEWMGTNSGAVETTLFYILAALAIPFAYGVIFDRAVIRSGFLLIGMFGAVSALFLLLQAQFLAMAQIMIYAVGITLVVVIALMLTNPKLDNELSPGVTKHSLTVFFWSALLFVTIYMAVRSEGWPVTGRPVDVVNNLVIIGQALTTTYALPFEFASILLLAALIGAVMRAKSDRKDTVSQYTDADAAESAEVYTASSR